MAQRARAYVEVPEQRFHPGSLEDSCVEKRLCLVEQTSVW